MEYAGHRLRWWPAAEAMTEVTVTPPSPPSVTVSCVRTAYLVPWVSGHNLPCTYQTSYEVWNAATLHRSPKAGLRPVRH